MIFSVTRNVEGDSEPATTRSTPRPPSVPSAPTNVVVVPGIRNLTVRFDPPSSDGGSPITGYSVTVQLAGESVASAKNKTTSNAEQLEFIVGDLEPNVPYLVSVFAINIIGDGISSLPQTGIPLDDKPVERPPARPTNVRVTPQVKKLIVTWGPPLDNGGTPITRYQIAFTNTLDGRTFFRRTGPQETSVILNNLVAGVKYTVLVAAENEKGIGASASGEGTPLFPFQPGVPASPQALQIFPEVNGLTVQWQAPLSDGGSSIRQYVITYRMIYF